jgi:hypothetical protein
MEYSGDTHSVGKMSVADMLYWLRQSIRIEEEEGDDE